MANKWHMGRMDRITKDSHTAPLAPSSTYEGKVATSKSSVGDYEGKIATAKADKSFYEGKVVSQKSQASDYEGLVQKKFDNKVDVDSEAKTDG